MPSFIIEVRDPLYQRIGLVENYIDFEAIIRLNAVGSWSLTIPGGVPEVQYLLAGNGVIARIEGQPEVAFSGPITKITHAWDESNQGAGTVTISGVTDDQLVFERITYPIPENDLDHQTDDRHTFISNAAYLMEYLVRQNCGPDARPERIYPELDVSSSPGVGESAMVSTRFDVLGELLQEIANSRGFGFRIRQGIDDERLLFEVFAPEDKSQLVFGKEHGNLQGYSYDIEAPTAARVVFAAQGEGKDRYFQDVDFNTGVVATWDDRDSRITYSTPAPLADPAAYLGTISALKVFNRTASFSFTGTGFRVYGEHEDTFFWQDRIVLDGVSSVVTITALPDVPQSLLYEVKGLTRGLHAVQLAATYGFDLDFIEILDERDMGDWRRNSERFYDRRDIPIAWNAAHNAFIDPGEGGIPANPSIYEPLFDQATLEAWEENGPKASLSLSPTDTDAVMYGRDYQVGDIVTVDINGVLFTDVLREVRLSDGSDGPRITPTIGDTQASSTPALYRTVKRLWSKVRKLEAQ